MPAVSTGSHELSDTCGEKAVIHVELNAKGEPSWCRKRHENDGMVRGGRFSCSQALRKLQPCRTSWFQLSSSFPISRTAITAATLLCDFTNLQLIVWTCSDECMSGL